MEAVIISIEDKMGKSTTKGLAREFNFATRTMEWIVKDDLGLKCYKRTPRQGVKAIDHQKRLEHAKILLNKLKKKPADTVIIFCDETPFSH